MYDNKKDNYKKETFASIELNGMTDQSTAENREIKITKNHILFGSWLLVLVLWINWSLNHDGYLLQQAIPALMIINFLLMIKAMGEK